MIYIREVLVTPLYKDKVQVTWLVNNTHEKEIYHFYLYVTDDPSGNAYEQVNIAPIINEYSYEFSIPVAFKQEYLYIILEVEVAGDKQSHVPVTFTAKISRSNFLIAKEIMRKKDLKRKVFSGVDCYILKRKTYGDKCDVCIDPGTGLIKNNNCPVCYGTRIKGGYHKPIERKCEIVEGERRIANTEIGTQENITGVAFLTYPMLFRGDLIVEKDRNKRWYVESIARNMIQTYPIDQKIEVRQLSPSDMEYTINVQSLSGV